MRSSTVFATLAAAGTILVSLPALGQQEQHGRKYVPPAPVTRVTVHVTKESNGKPVANAAVIFHPLKNGRDDGNLELKTDEDGVAELDLLPQKSSAILQVVAPGFQTYGQTFSIDGDQQKIDVQMKRPAGQYTAYGLGSTNDHSKAGASGMTLTPLSSGSAAAAGTSTPQALENSNAAAPAPAPAPSMPGDSAPSDKH